MKRLYSPHLILSLLGILFAPATQAASEQTPPLYSKGDKFTFISVGNYCGIDESKAIDISHLSFGTVYYFTHDLGLYGEVLAMATRGERDGVD